MTDKELRRLSKENLLQIMIDQQRRIESLEQALAEKEAALKDQTARNAETETLKEVSERLIRMMDDTQKSARAYLEDLRSLADECEDRTLPAGSEPAVSGRRRRLSRRTNEND